jgi:hypothetical protein
MRVRRAEVVQALARRGPIADFKLRRAEFSLAMKTAQMTIGG